MSDWYARQFGDRDRFAISISLGRDPHPVGDAEIDAGWGGLSIWVRGRCLTRSVSSDGSVSDEVRWSLTSILRWFIDASVRLFNEEPFPDPTALNKVRDACAWYDSTGTPVVTLTEAEEDEWFLRRSNWRQHHALRRAAIDAALPNIMFRRLGDFLEVSWDNETWRTSRPGLSFVEQRGTELISAKQAASDLRTALVDVTQNLEEHCKLQPLKALAEEARLAEACCDDWRWLIYSETAHTIAGELESLRKRLSDHVVRHRTGLFIPHTLETLVLRQARLVSASEIQSLLDAVKTPRRQPMRALIRDLIRPSAASATSPWEEGYKRALEVRDALGWANDPTPNLREWMVQNNIGVNVRPLPPALDVVAVRTSDQFGMAVVNPRARSRVRREIAEATALGHILFDQIPVALDGTWEHWPSAARARAFAAMLMLPDDGVRDVLAGRTNIDASDVRRVMDHYMTGPYATTYHLQNRGFITDDERRIEILRDLAA